MAHTDPYSNSGPHMASSSFLSAPTHTHWEASTQRRLCTKFDAEKVWLQTADPRTKREQPPCHSWLTPYIQCRHACEMFDFASHQVVTARTAAVLHKNSARLCDLEFGMALYHPSHTGTSEFYLLSFQLSNFACITRPQSTKRIYSWDLAAVANALPIPRTSFCLIRSYCFAPGFAAGFKIFQ